MTVRRAVFVFIRTHPTMNKLFQIVSTVAVLLTAAIVSARLSPTGSFYTIRTFSASSCSLSSTITVDAFVKGACIRTCTHGLNATKTTRPPGLQRVLFPNYCAHVSAGNLLRVLGKRHEFWLSSRHAHMHVRRIVLEYFWLYNTV
jgi:hypothetical protein